MAKRKSITQKIKPSPKPANDTVIFMTAYDIHNIKKHHFRFGKRTNRKELWEQYHIAGLSHNNTYVTPYAKCQYVTEYNSLKQVTAFQFDESFEQYNKKYNSFADEMISTIYLQHSANSLLDQTLLHIDTCFKLDRFLVVFDEKVYQVDPIAFILSGSLLVNFELIDFETGVPINAKSIYGRSNNYNIKPVSKLRYFNKTEFKDDNRKISDIVFENIYGFLTKSTNKWEIGNYSYVHNILVLSNEIENIEEYFQSVLGGEIEDFSVKNISATDSFKFYSTEYLGVVTDILDGNDKHHILNDCMLLESFKIFILLKMIIDYEVHHKLDEIIDHQIYAQSQLHPLNVPIITFNVIDNLQNTYSFKRYKQSIDFKLQTLKIYQDRRIGKNGLLLNILLYILAIMGSFQTLQVMQTELGIPFKFGLIAIVIIFTILGLIWFIRERKE